MTSETSQPGHPDLRDQLLRECRAMARHALAAGLKVPRAVAQALALVDEGADGSRLSTGRLAVLHGRLAQIVAPATPRAILYLAREETRSGFLTFLGPVRLVRFMVLVAIGCIVGFICVSLSPEVDVDPLTTDPLASEGTKLLLNELFFIFAAGLGASFAALFKVSGFIAARTYDPTYEATYWVRFLLGLISGLILATIVQFDTADNGSLSHIGGKPALALLGGFSADLVYRVLTRLIESVETLVRGDTKERAAVQDERTKARFEQQTHAMRIDMAAKVVDLQRRLSEGAKPDEVREMLGRMLGELVPGDTDDLHQEAGTEPIPDDDLNLRPGKGGKTMGKEKSEAARDGQTRDDGESEAAKASEAAE